MPSVVIAAHDEAALIDRCLEALARGAEPGVLDVTVVANGCSDDTAARAAAHPGVRVVELAEAGKARALNAGDAVAQGFPRVYLDADIPLTGGDLLLLCDRLAAAGALVAVPRRELVLTGRPLPVRAYYAVHRRLPVFEDGLFGRGAIAVSAAGRSRFEAFPEVIADDLFLDSQFASDERAQCAVVASPVETPCRTGDLVRRLVRVRRGNAQLRASGGSAVRGSSQWSWLRDVVLPRPWLAPAAVVYVAITVCAARAARRVPTAGAEWGRDESSRRPEGRPEPLPEEAR
jgi:glycosyltransferase involved in cell wall biosynthesis